MGRRLRVAGAAVVVAATVAVSCPFDEPAAAALPPVARADVAALVAYRAEGLTAASRGRVRVRVSAPVTVELPRTGGFGRGIRLVGRAVTAAPADADRRARIGVKVRARARVVGFARAQIGDPYRFGAAGPGAWDCSGLVLRAYARVGVRLPRTSGAQADRGVRVGAGDAVAGDLVAWPGHVGVYAGAGWVIHAPRPGQRVERARLWGSPTFRRVLG